jgi:hypothetical protein
MAALQFKTKSSETSKLEFLGLGYLARKEKKTEQCSSLLMRTFEERKAVIVDQFKLAVLTILTSQ